MRRAGREDADAIDVELVETFGTDSGEDLQPPEPPAVEETADTGTEEGARRHRRPWLTAIPWTAVGVVVALAWGVSALQGAQRDAAREESLARSPGVLDPIDGPLEEAWRTDDGVLLTEAGGLLIVGDRSTVTGDGTVRGLDARTGERIWEYRTPLGMRESFSCRSLTHDRGSPETGGRPEEVTTPSAADGVLVGCAGSTPTDASGHRSPTSTVVVLDPRTGDEIMSAQAEGSLMRFAGVDGNIALVLQRVDGYLAAAAWSIDTGRQAWSYRSEEPVMNGSWSYTGGPGLDHRIFVLDGEPGMVLDLTTGTEVTGARAAVPVAAGPANRILLNDGGTVEWTPSRNGRGSGRVLDADGTQRFAFDGFLPEPVSDGSAPGLLVVIGQRDPGFSVLDARNGDVLWRVDALGWPSAVLDGLVVVTGVDTVRALRARDGTEVWSLAAPGAQLQEVLTDGSVLLVRRDAGSRRVLAAVAARDGSQLWQMPMPEEVRVLGATSAGDLMGILQDGFVVYR